MVYNKMIVGADAKFQIPCRKVKELLLFNDSKLRPVDYQSVS